MLKTLHILGASGSGTTSMGKAISKKYGYAHFDTDDYFWLPTDIPYTVKRETSDRRNMLKSDMNKVEKCVITGSMCDWGDIFKDKFNLVIYLNVPTDIRIERLEKRELSEWGNRILLGGDMYENHNIFIEWAKTYDTAGIDSRSFALHQQWLKNISCPVLILDGTKKIEVLLQEIDKYINTFPFKFNAEISSSQIAALRKSVGWNEMQCYYDKSLQNSYFYICCFDNDKLIGFLDVVSNKVTDAYIQDVMVNPEYQKKVLVQYL